MYCIFLCLAFYNSVYSVLANDPLVYIDQGWVRGLRAEDGNYTYFRGIPYRKVDPENPFGPSLPPAAFHTDIFDAFDGTLKCPQYESTDPILLTNNQIDCLTLNVYVPNSANTENPLPVLVYIHGGGFSAGYADEYGIPNFVHHDVVVVTPNYRVSIYGFLCLDSPLAPGNQGLKDQLEALRWVKRNIQAFGGDPDDVTLGGLSAGGRSVLYHLYSPQEKLYNKVLTQSGVPRTLFAERDPQAAVKLAEYLGCKTSNDAKAIRFLSETSHDLVVAAAHHIGLSTAPCLEKYFEGHEQIVVSNPYEISNLDKVKDIPVLIGCTENELQEQITSDAASHNLLRYTDNAFYNMLLENFVMEDNLLISLEEILRQFYLGDVQPTSSEASKGLSEFLSDSIYIYPVQRTITDLLAENAGPIYSYVFSYSLTGGAEHATDVQYLFVNKWDNEEQQLISDRYSLLFSNFVKYGNPTPEETDLVPFIWSAVTAKTRPHIVIDTNIRMDSRFNHKRISFWDLFYLGYQKYNKHNVLHDDVPSYGHFHSLNVSLAMLSSLLLLPFTCLI